MFFFLEQNGVSLHQPIRFLIAEQSKAEQYIMQKSGVNSLALLARMNDYPIVRELSWK